MYMQLSESARNVLTLRLDNTLLWIDRRGDHPKMFRFSNLLSKFYPPLPAFLGQIEGFLPESAMDDLWTKSGDTAPLVGANSYGASAESLWWLGRIESIDRSLHRFWKLKNTWNIWKLFNSRAVSRRYTCCSSPLSLGCISVKGFGCVECSESLDPSGLGSCNGSWLRQESRVCHGMESTWSENHQWNLDWSLPISAASYSVDFVLEFMTQRERVEGIVSVQLLNSECIRHVGSASKSLFFAAMPRISTIGIIGAADPYHLWAWRFHRFFLWLQDLFLPGGGGQISFTCTFYRLLEVLLHHVMMTRSGGVQGRNTDAVFVELLALHTYPPIRSVTSCSWTTSFRLGQTRVAENLNTTRWS